MCKALLSQFFLRIYFGLRWVFVAARGISLVSESKGLLSSCRAWASLVELGLQGCELQQLHLVGPGARARQLWHMSPVAPWHVESSWTRGGTQVPCMGRWILNHRTSREVLSCLVKEKGIFWLSFFSESGNIEI